MNVVETGALLRVNTYYKHTQTLTGMHTFTQSHVPTCLCRHIVS